MGPGADTSDAALLLAARAGDYTAFELFYRRWLPVVTRFHVRRGGSREAAFDLTAETFAAVVSSLGDFDPERGSAAGWLFGIAEHKLGSSRRRRRVEARARRELGYHRLTLDDEDLARVDELASLGGHERMQTLLAELSSDQEAAVRARVLDERSYVEIAVELRCSEAVVRQRVHRGLERLRERIATVPVWLLLALATAGAVKDIGRANPTAVSPLGAGGLESRCAPCRAFRDQQHGVTASETTAGDGGTGRLILRQTRDRRGLPVVAWSSTGEEVSRTEGSTPSAAMGAG